MRWVVIAFALFITFILYFVIKVQTDSQYDNQLVLENYYSYETGINAQNEKIQNANNLEDKLTIVAQDDKSISIHFPNQFDAAKITGMISFYRPSDKNLDFEIPISLSSSELRIPEALLAEGRWDVNINWEYEDTAYYSSESLKL